MATVNLSPIGNGAQFLTSVAVPLNGGKINTYAAGTTNPLSTFTTNLGTVSNANPIVLDSAGRPPNEIWLAAGNSYKFTLTDSLNNLIATYDNIPAINDISFIQPNAGAVSRTIQSKEQDIVSAFDFMTPTQISDVLAKTLIQDVTASLQAAINTGKSVYLPDGSYLISSALTFIGSQALFGNSRQSCNIVQATAGANGLTIAGKNYVFVRQLNLNCSATSTAIGIAISTGTTNFIDDVLVSAFNINLDLSSTNTVQIGRFHSVNSLSHGINIHSNGAAVVDTTLREVISNGSGGSGIAVTGLVSGLYWSEIETTANTVSGLVIGSNGDGQPSDGFIDKLIADSNLTDGVKLNTCNTIEFTDCWSSNRGSGSNWLVSATATDIRIIAPKTYFNSGHGIQVLGPRCSIIGPSCEDAGTGAADTYDNINVGGASANGTIIVGPRCISTRNTARYGIRIDGSATNTVTVGGNLSGNHVGAYSDNSGNSTNVLADTIGAAQASISFTPTDGSGAALSFTSVSGAYYIEGGRVTATGTVTYPATADGSTAAIALSHTAVSGIFPGSVISNSANAAYCQVASGTNNLNLFAAGTTSQSTNANLSGKIVRFNVTYFVS